MLGKSLKWMLLTLAVFALLFIGARAAYLAIFPPAEKPPVSVVADPAEGTPAPAGETATVPADVTAPPEETAAVPLTEEAMLAAYIDNMSMQDKLGQLVMFGFSGTTEPSDEFLSVLNEYHVGNIVLYGGNISRTDSDGGFYNASILTSRLEQRNPTEIPFLVSIDIEGGRVQRFKWDSAPVSAATLGKKNDYNTAYEQFYNVGLALRSVGINMNLAPVLDVAEEPMQTFLTTRIISSDADVAAAMGEAIIDGLRDAQCLSTAKHFPGHGATNEDTHATTPIVDKSAEALESYELIPFRAGIAAGVDMVLVAHILYPELDAADIASMSPVIIDGLLRGTLGFDGVVMSDDFRMGGLTTRYDVGEAAVQFITAGGDLILCGPRTDLQRSIMAALTAAASDGTLSEERINASVARILKKKMLVTTFALAEETAG